MIEKRRNPARAVFIKSSFSGSGNDCVEVARLTDGMLAVRDSKNRSVGVQLHTDRAWRAFTGAVRAGKFD